MFDRNKIIDAFLPALVQIESGGDPNAVGSKGERGLCQIMQATWFDMADEPFEKAFDPATNLSVARRYLNWIWATLSRWTGESTIIDIRDVLACYNGGIGRFRSMGYELGKMPESTQRYVEKVMAERARLDELAEELKSNE